MVTTRRMLVDDMQKRRRAIAARNRARIELARALYVELYYMNSRGEKRQRGAS